MDMLRIDISVWKVSKLVIKVLKNKVMNKRLSTTETEIVHTNYGPVKGLKRKTIYDEEFYYSFEGIPYALPPVGDLRFRAPQPPVSWKGVRDCTKAKHVARQKDILMQRPIGSEDCLFLNVYVKQLKSEKPLPVMVWIHGGGFQFGGSGPDWYDGTYFMKKDVILVTLNYRLGVLGFLSLKDPTLNVPGNAGLKDQVMALRWIKDNIRYFNGDPNNITVFGESAGSASVHFMLLTEQTRGLFHKAIMQSGSVLCPWVDSLEQHWAYRLARKLGYHGENEDASVFRFLQRVDSNKFVRHDNRLNTLADDQQHLMFPFGPVVEPYDSENCITLKPFKELLISAWGNDIPLLIGGNSFEGLFFYQKAQELPHLVDELGDCTTLVPHDVKTNISAMKLKEKGLVLKQAYFEDKEPSMASTFFSFLDLVSYKHFWHGIYRTLLARFAYAPHSPTYLYRFDFYSADFNQVRMLVCENVRGVSHADELSYLFYNRGSYKVGKNTAEYATIERMIDIWTTFAETSNPNCSATKSCNWTPVIQENDLKCLNISNTIQSIELPEKKKLDIWNSLYNEVSLY